MDSDELCLTLIVIGVVLFIFFCGFFAAYEPAPTEFTNDCMMYYDTYYCPTDMPENVVMPVE